MTFLALISDWDRYWSKRTHCKLHEMRTCFYQGRNGWDLWRYHQHATAILANICTIWFWIRKSWQAESRPVACFGYHIPPSVIGSSVVSFWSRKSPFWEVLQNPWCDHVAPFHCCNCLFSRKHAELYLKNMCSYLSGLKELFPEYTLHPNHHMALHLFDYLLLYGPVHSWWTFPFERLIGILQHISTNYKIGRFFNLFSSSILIDP